ncbi:hypothetical protein jhhlp_003644 [Lomentospora prolificans]|uniref:Uncharacterized protein n=1 Tax=Lomentospora prolificans TaxID=41688 RepID=A0A2N3N9D1_9PEZI|nr:hypothetical protein jhhlp_003644 [Lomentospora prolificans]
MNNSRRAQPTRGLPRPLSIVKKPSMQQLSYDLEGRGRGSIDTVLTDPPLVTMTKRTTRPCQFVPEPTPPPPLRVQRTRPRRSMPVLDTWDDDDQQSYGLYSSASEISSSETMASGAFDPTDSPFLDTEMCTPHVLVPTIRITPEIDVIGDGETSIWVAVEVAASLRRPDGVDPMGKRTARDGSGVQLEMMHSALSPVSYGCLYDLFIEVLPVGGTTVLDVIQDERLPIALNLNTAVLLLIHLRLPPFPPHTRSRSNASTSLPPTSDFLFRDLEAQLGTSAREYLRLRVSYCHSAFAPSSPRPDLSTSTRLETVASASIRRRDLRSLWARDGSVEAKAKKNSRIEDATGMSLLVGIAMRHWDWDKARRAVEMVIRSRESGESASLTHGDDGGETRKGRETAINWDRQHQTEYAAKSGSIKSSRRLLARNPDCGGGENAAVGNAMPFSVPARQTSLRKRSGGPQQQQQQQQQQQKQQQKQQQCHLVSVGVGDDSSDLEEAVQNKMGSARWSWSWW